MRLDFFPFLQCRRVRNLVSLLGVYHATRFVLAQLRGSKLVKLKLSRFPLSVWVRPSGSDIKCLWQVFGLRDCDCQIENCPRVIIDGGANAGFATMFYLAKFPDALVVAVEPDPSNVEMIKLNTGNSNRVVIVESALWGRNAWLRISNPSDESWEFRVEETDMDAVGAFQGMTIGRLLEEVGLKSADIVKLDIEGAEKNVFAARDLNWLGNIQELVIEVHGADALNIVTKAIESRPFARVPQGEKLRYTRHSNSPL